VYNLKPDGIKPYSQMDLLSYGIIAAVVAGVLSFIVFSTFFGLAIGCAAFVLAGGAVLQPGLHKIPIQWVGVMLLFGKRLENCVATEGLMWLPPGIMGFALIDRHLQTNDFKDEEVPTEEGAVEVDTTVQWYVEDPFKYLSVESSTTIQDGLRSAISGTVREWMRDKNMEKARNSKRTAISETIRNEVDALAEDWGINIDKIFVTDIKLPSEVEEAYAKRAKELQEQKAEKTELDHVAERINALHAATGLPKDTCAEIVQAERKKLTRKAVHLSGSTGDSIRDHAATSSVDITDKE
jgi:regulator of protease activity HflC (stomatin/prohibitin superfamily)